MRESTTLRELSAEIWEVEHIRHEGGMRLRMRMTIVRRAGGALWLHSPIPISDELADELAELGTVRDIVAPNRFHHRFAHDAKRRYAGATLWGAPGLREKCEDVPFDAELAEGAPWQGDLEAMFLRGAPLWNEHVFFHAPSRSLICTDLLFNIRDEPNLPSRLLYRGLGVWKRFGTNRLWRSWAKDRSALGGSVQRVSGHDVRRVIMAHGDVYELANQGELASALQPLGA